MRGGTHHALGRSTRAALSPTYYATVRGKAEVADLCLPYHQAKGLVSSGWTSTMRMTHTLTDDGEIKVTTFTAEGEYTMWLSRNETSIVDNKPLDPPTPAEKKDELIAKLEKRRNCSCCSACAAAASTRAKSGGPRPRIHSPQICSLSPRHVRERCCGYAAAPSEKIERVILVSSLSSARGRLVPT